MYPNGVRSRGRSRHYRSSSKPAGSIAYLALGCQTLEPRTMLTTLVSGEEAFDSFGTGFSDSFEIHANAGDSVWVSVGETGALAAQPVLYLYDPMGEYVTFDNGADDALVRIPDALAGTYTAVVSDGSNNQPMNFRIRAVTLPSSPLLIAGRDNALASGEEVEASFPLGSFNVFPIAVNEGDSLHVSVGETGDLSASPLLYLYDSAGQYVTFDNGANDALVRVTDALAGTYTAVVADSNNDEPMSFRIRAVTLPSSPQLIAGRDNELASGEEVEASLPLGSFNVFPITVNQGDSLHVSVGEMGDLSASPLLYLYDSAGQYVTFDNGADDALVRVTDALAGTYTAVVIDANNDQPMSFRIRALSAPSNPLLIASRDNALSSGEEFEASFPLGSFNVFPIAVNQGDSLHVSVGETGDLSASPLLYLYDSAGQYVDFDNGADDAFVRVTDALAGTYTAVVIDANNDQPMSFRIRAVTAPSNPLLIAGRDNVLASGEEFEASFPLGSFSVFPIEVNQGDSLHVSVGKMGDLSASPLLYLYDSAGQYVTFDNGANDALIRITHALAGTYTAVVADANNDQPMSFRIRVVTLPSDPQLIAGRDQRLVAGMPWEATSPLGSFNVYQFDARVGDDVEIELAKIDGPGSPSFRVYDPAGELITFNSSSTVAIGTFAASAAGVYTVIVGDSINSQPLHHRIVVNGNTGTFSPIRGRQVFYNNSAFDLTTDDEAIAPKQPLLPGSASSFANFTSFVSGVNGVMIDLADAPAVGSIAAADFTLRTGKTSDTSTWDELLTAPSVSVREGEGADFSDRIVLTWPDSTIANTWLEVTLHATGNTGLAADHVFYFGNQIGDANGNGQVNATDYALVRANPANFLNPADVDNLFDMNRDGRVNAADLSIIRDHATILGTGLPMITPSGASGMKAEVGRRSIESAPILTPPQENRTSRSAPGSQRQSATASEIQEVRSAADDRALVQESATVSIASSSAPLGDAERATALLDSLAALNDFFPDAVP